MSLLDDIKKRFRGIDMPEDTRRIIEEAESPANLIQRVEDLKAQNLLDLHELENRALLLDRKMQEESDALNRAGAEGEADIHARRIELYEAERDSLRGRMALYSDNARMHLSIISKVQELEAMRARGVSERLLDNLAESSKEEAGIDARVRMAAEEISQSLGTRTQQERASALEAIKKRYKKSVTEPSAETRVQRPEVE
jgi:hypothetical protein